MARCVASVLALVVLLPAASHAVQERADSDAEVAKASRLIDEGDFQGAIDILQPAVRRLALNDRQSRQLARGYLYLGISYLMLREEEAGKGYFREALKEDPGLVIDEARHPAKVVRAFADVQRDLRPAPAPSSATPTYVTDAQEFMDRTQIYVIQRKIKERELENRLLSLEAKSRNVSTETLIQLEVDGRVPAGTEAEARAFYEANRSRFGNRTEEVALREIADGLRSQRKRERQDQLIRGLRAKFGEYVALEPPRLLVSPDDDPSSGPLDAKVVIIEFADFQCPFSSRSTAVLRDIKSRYGSAVRHVFRDFPLVAIHPEAGKAAEAATCAHEQGRFWPMHDLLFANQKELTTTHLNGHARALGLDAARFAECLQSGRYEAEWRRDAADAERYAVKSTPAFFINGRLLVGAQPYAAFEEVIEEELRSRTASGAVLDTSSRGH